MNNELPRMTLNEYQSLALRTRGRYDSDVDRLKCAGLGLCGEAGEVAELIKKKLFHMKQVDNIQIAKELGDVLWYLSDAADSIGFNLELIAVMNIEKLKARYPDGFSYRASNERKD